MNCGNQVAENRRNKKKRKKNCGRKWEEKRKEKNCGNKVAKNEGKKKCYIHNIFTTN